MDRMFQLMQENILHSLKSCDFGREIDALSSVLFPDPHGLLYFCEEIKRDLYAALRPVFSSVRLAVFGSAVMGMAFTSEFCFSLFMCAFMA